MITGFSSISRAVKRLSTPHTVIRAAVSTYDDHGRLQEQPETELTIRAHVQSTGDKELELLSEGDRVKGSIRYWTTDEVFTVDVDGATKADVLMWQGHRYKATKIDDRTPLGGYNKVIAVREGQ